ncbi:hypothetical protein NQ318_021806 [Aromia moschata]|uniref:Uncharacterized protein n=1 Tax=Aromia moschata TaxID=1265417 RepID=A0AAV8Z8P3_9CUCU|nr:hypothetical protein NQ318_021806 [Aromia moschata]
MTLKDVNLNFPTNKNNDLQMLGVRISVPSSCNCQKWPPCIDQSGYARSMGLEPRGVRLGMVDRVAGTPSRNRGVAKNIRSSDSSRPVKTVFSNLKENLLNKKQVLTLYPCSRHEKAHQSQEGSTRLQPPVGNCVK